MSAIDQVFRNLSQARRAALIPFITAGDPDLGFTEEALLRLASSGADICELGIPYSDPIADGAVIQASYTRALASGIRVGDILDMLSRLSGKLGSPVVLMVSYAIVLRRGLGPFVRQCSAAGVAGFIVPDLPVEEAGPLADLCNREGLSLIQLVTPTTPRPRALKIVQSSSGFVYYVSVTGITGERDHLPAAVTENVMWLKTQTKLPVCVGFGISRADQAQAIGRVADGVIIGSALVRRIAEVDTRPRAEVLREIEAFVSQLRKALDEATTHPCPPLK